MNLKKSIQKSNNIKKIKHFKTESILKTQDFSKALPLDKKIIKKFNYRLFKLNESNKNNNLNNIQHYTCKDLFSDILVKNFTNNSIKSIHILNSNSKNYFINKNYSGTTNNFKIHKIFSKKSTKLIPRHIIKNKPKYNSQESNDIINNKNINYKNNNENKIKYGLFPLYYLNKKKVIKLNKKKTLNNNLYFDKGGDYYRVSGENDILSKTNYTNIKAPIKNKTRNKFNKRKIKENSISLPEENDMKPKIRFINLRKDLLEENLKINRMFADFNREIAEKEKILKFIGKHKGGKEDILKIF